MRWLAILPLLAACSTATFYMQRQAEHDLECDEVVVEEQRDGRVLATGCARSASYRCRTETDEWAGVETVCEREPESAVAAEGPLEPATEPTAIRTASAEAERLIREHLQARSAAARACLDVETLAISATIEAEGRVRFELRGAELRTPEAACVADVLGLFVVMDGDAGTRVVHVLR